MLTHPFVTTYADAGDATKLQPSDHNREHRFAGGATGSILYRDSAAETAHARGTYGGASWLADVATGNVLLSGGVGAAPSYGKVTLTGHVSGILPVANGGTAIASYAVGDLLYANGAASLAKLGSSITGNVLLSGGVETAPAWGKVGLATHVSGTLAAPNGGTGQASYAVGDLLYADTAGTLTRLAAVAAGSYLRSNGVTTAPLWSTLVLPNAATANRVVYATGANAWGESANLTFDGTGLAVIGTIGLGAAVGDDRVHIKASDANLGLRIENTGTGGQKWRVLSTGGASGVGQGFLWIENETTGNGALAINAAGSLFMTTAAPAFSDYFARGLYIGGTTPGLSFQETGVDVDEKIWDFYVDAEVFHGRVLNDAINSSENWLQVTRNGAVIGEVRLVAETFKLKRENSGPGMVLVGESSADHAAPGANNAVLYLKDVGGKTALFARFASGAAQQIAIEP